VWTVHQKSGRCGEGAVSEGLTEYRSVTVRCLQTFYKHLRGSLPKSGPLDFATKNTFPLFFVGEEALVGIY